MLWQHLAHDSMMVTPTQTKTPDSSRTKLERQSERIPSSASRTHDFNLAPPPSDQAPECLAIPGYSILKLIGRGGMGAVYQAHQHSLDRTVAIKMIHGGCLAGEDDKFRFRLEAEVTARIKHPNIVQVFEAGTFLGRPYLVMEWVNGGTLQEWQAAKPIDPRLAAEFMIQLAEGMHDAHALGVIHRDLKPTNILLSCTDVGHLTSSNPTLRQKNSAAGDGCLAQAPILKITDFGMAKRLQEGAASVTQTGYTVGTPQYMAPEQARGRQDIGVAADIYALGAIFYELLTGQPPFRGTAHVVLYQVITEEPQAPARHVPNLPQDAVSICSKCMRKEPQARYSSALELAADLRRFLSGYPVLARPVPTLVRWAMWARRHPAVACLVVALTLTILSSLLGMSYLYLRADRDRYDAVRAKEHVLQEKEAMHELNRFVLRDVMGQANPEKTLGKDPTFRAVIKKAAETLETAVKQQLDPKHQLQAQARLTYGQVLAKLKRYQEAVPYLEEAATRADSFGPALSNVRKQAISDLIMSLTTLGRHRESQEWQGRLESK